MRRSDLTRYQLNKVAKGKCCYSGCGKPITAKNRLMCYHHKHQMQKINNPLSTAYNTLRLNAKRRGKEFAISFQYFKDFCAKTKIMLGRGIKADSYHIDRIKEELGYVEGNLQVLTNTENLKKYREYDWYLKRGTTVTIKYDNNSDVPF